MVVASALPSTNASIVSYGTSLASFQGRKRLSPYIGKVEWYTLKPHQVGEQKAGTADRPTYHTRRANRDFLNRLVLLLVDLSITGLVSLSRRLKRLLGSPVTFGLYTLFIQHSRMLRQSHRSREDITPKRNHGGFRPNIHDLYGHQL